MTTSLPECPLHISCSNAQRSFLLLNHFRLFNKHPAAPPHPDQAAEKQPLTKDEDTSHQQQQQQTEKQQSEQEQAKKPFGYLLLDCLQALLFASKFTVTPIPKLENREGL